MSTKERLDAVAHLLDEVLHDEAHRLTMTTIGLLTEAQRDVEVAGRHLGED